MIKLIACVKKPEEMSFEQFANVWRNEHADLVCAMPGVLAYTQNVALDGSRREWPFDGVAEVWFSDKESMNSAFGSPEGQLAVEHEKKFSGSVTWLLAEEDAIRSLDDSSS